MTSEKNVKCKQMQSDVYVRSCGIFYFKPALAGLKSVIWLSFLLLPPFFQDTFTFVGYIQDKVSVQIDCNQLKPTSDTDWTAMHLIAMTIATYTY